MCIMMHLVLCIDAFRLAFCTILPCVLLHFTLRFAANSVVFCCKTQSVLQQNARFFPKIAILCIIQTLFRPLQLRPFRIKQNPREN